MAYSPYHLLVDDFERAFSKMRKEYIIKHTEQDTFQLTCKQYYPFLLFSSGVQDGPAS